MGLKTTNYEVKSKGITLPQAYAIIRDIEIHGTTGVATIVIQQSRELAVNKVPFEEYKVYFKVNRNENPYETAYAKAKAPIIRRELVDCEKEGITGMDENEQPIYGTIYKELVDKEYPNLFTGWEDDILLEQ